MMFDGPQIVDRIAGCLLAGALGDAIGAYYEGRPQVDCFRIPDVLRITDDTQLTIATCEAILQTQRVDPESIANRFLHWHRQRRIRGIGSSTLKALTELDAGGHWALVGATGERAAGNGAAMRIAPLAFILNADVDSDRQVIRDVCRITHRNDEAYIGALAIVRAIRSAVSEGLIDSRVFSSLVATLPDSRVRDRILLLQSSPMTPKQYAMQFGASGYVVDSAPLAILAATQATDFLSMTEQIVQCGGDTDTVASIFGQIYGAAHGTKSLPMHLLSQIDEANVLQEFAARLGVMVPN